MPFGQIVWKIHNCTLNKVGVAIFGYFAEDWGFGTYPMLFLGVKLATQKQWSYSPLN